MAQATKADFLSSNLRYMRKKVRKLSQQELAAELGISRGALGSYEEGRAEPKLTLLTQIAQFFGVSVDALLNQDLTAAPAQSLTAATATPSVEAQAQGYRPSLRILTVTVDADDHESIVLVPEKAEAGYASGYADPTYLATLPQYKLPFLPENRTYRAFEIHGESMLPLQSGTIVVGEFVEDPAQLKDGETCVVVSRNEGIVLKRVFQRAATPGKLLLKSSNLAFRPYEIPQEEVEEVWKYAAHIATEIPRQQPDVQTLTEVVYELQDAVLKMEQGRHATTEANDSVSTSASYNGGPSWHS